MFSIFKSRAKINAGSLVTDIHSHLLPMLDDGAKSFDEAADLIAQFAELGYAKLITTPHINSDTYRNSPTIIAARHSDLAAHLQSRGISISLQVAAEYYLDEVLLDKITGNKPLLTFGAKYLLFETNFLSETFLLKEFIFSATTRGYKLVMAHPERYQYLMDDFEKVEDLKHRGVLFQINIPAILGAYNRPVQNLAIQLIEKGWVDFLGSDCHNQFHMDVLKKAYKNKYFQKALALPLLNRSL